MLPHSGFLNGRAVSAPDYGHYDDGLPIANPFWGALTAVGSAGDPQYQPLSHHLVGEAGSPDGNEQPLSGSVNGDVLMSESASPPAPVLVSPTTRQNAPAHMDAIASLLLELSTAANSASTSAEALSFASGTSSLAGVTFSASSAAAAAAPHSYSSNAGPSVVQLSAAAAAPSPFPFAFMSPGTAPGSAIQLSGNNTRYPLVALPLHHSPHLPLVGFTPGATAFVPARSSFTKYGMALTNHARPPIVMQRAVSDATQVALKRPRQFVLP